MIFSQNFYFYPTFGIMEAIRLDSPMKKQAAEVCARAFFDYPMFTFIYPDRARRERYLASHFDVMVNYGLQYGQLYTSPECSGVSCWLPPESIDMTLFRIIRAGGLSVIPRIGLIRSFTHNIKHENYLAKVQKEIMPGPHFYLWAIAVDPDLQGMGIGKALMKPGLDQADKQNVPIYLETHDEKNIIYYEKFGFELVREERLPGFDLKFWCMARSPK